MKKILFTSSVIVLLAAGCNQSQQTSNKNTTQNAINQNSNQTSHIAPSPTLTTNPTPTSTEGTVGVKTNSFEWCMANGGKNETPNYNAPKVCVLSNKVYEDNCVGNSKYFVISRDSSEGAGTDILVKYKSSPDQIFSCNYIKQSGDLEVGGDGTYVLALENNFLLLDVGTGPDPRVLTIYNLNTRKGIYNDSYSQPVNIQNNVIDYWTGTTTPVTQKNCPDFITWETRGLGTAIEVHVSLNLLTLTKTELGEYRCSPEE